MNNEQRQEKACKLRDCRSNLQIEVKIQQKWITDLSKAVDLTERKIEIINGEIKKLIPPIKGNCPF